MNRLEDLIRQVLVELGEDPERPGLKLTPQRVEQALRFMTQGYRQDARQVIGGALFREAHNNMVLVRDVEFYSLCEHHMLPFYGRVHVAYIPDGCIVGPVQAGPRGRRLCPAAPGAGADDRPDRRRARSRAPSTRRRRRGRRGAPLHDDARRARSRVRAPSPRRCGARSSTTTAPATSSSAWCTARVDAGHVPRHQRRRSRPSTATCRR